MFWKHEWGSIMTQLKGNDGFWNLRFWHQEDVRPALKSVRTCWLSSGSRWAWRGVKPGKLIAITHKAEITQTYTNSLSYTFWWCDSEIARYVKIHDFCVNYQRNEFWWEYVNRGWQRHWSLNSGQSCNINAEAHNLLAQNTPPTLIVRHIADK